MRRLRRSSCFVSLGPRSVGISEGMLSVFVLMQKSIVRTIVRTLHELMRGPVLELADLALRERVLQYQLHLSVAGHACVAHVEHKVVTSIQYQGSRTGNVS